MKKKLIIFGSDMMAKMAHFYFSNFSEYQVEAFSVDAKYRTVDNFCGREVIDFEKLIKAYSPQEIELFVAIGPSQMNKNRERKYIEIKKAGYRLATFISPTAKCYSPVGENCMITDFVMIHPFVEIGNNCFFWDYTFISHDSRVGDHCYFSPFAKLGTHSIVKNNVTIGTDATIKTGLTIAEETLVGAGCYISEDTVKNGVYGEKCSQMYGAISHKINFT